MPHLLKEGRGLKERNPESALPLFPTEDHWTWSTVIPTNPIPVMRKQTPVGDKLPAQSRLGKGKEKEVVAPTNTQSSENGLPDFLNEFLGPEPTHDWWDDPPQTMTNNAGPSVQPNPTNQTTPSGMADRGV
jgi:hypothetical protein